MAAPDNPPNLLYTSHSQDDVIRLGGFHRELFIKEFSILEEALVICTICQGVKKEATMFQGVTTCRCCSYSPDRATEVEDIRDLVARLQMRCPLSVRGCTWRGKVADIESHVRNCKELLVPCQTGCGVGIARGSTEKHVGVCTLRDTTCDHCGAGFKAKYLDEHLSSCQDCPVACPHCNASMKRSQLDEHIRVACEKVQLKVNSSNQIKPEEFVDSDSGSSAHKQQENILEKLLSEKITKLENETVELKERVFSLERKNGVLTKALLCKAELTKYDSVTGRVLEGVRWPILGVDHLTKIVSTVESHSFYIAHHNLVLIASIGMLNSVSFTVTRIAGRFDEIVEPSALNFYRCEVVGVKEGGDPFVKSERINHHQLKLGEKCQPFGFIDVSVLRDQAYCTEDSITLHFYFDLTH